LKLCPAIGKPQAFRYDPEAGFEWLGDWDITADELLSNKKQSPSEEPESKLDKAIRLIESALADGAVVAAEDIIKEIESQGISESTRKRAMKAVGVISEKQGDHWVWTLPTGD
jgi:hypothetical protein